MGSLEREMKLRVWWLVYTADRSSASIEDHQPLLIEDMCDTVDLPAQMLVEWSVVRSADCETAMTSTFPVPPTRFPKIKPQLCRDSTIHADCGEVSPTFSR
jgi:hypothetical protein